MSKRLSSATCLAVAIAAALGSPSADALSPSSLPLIGSLLPTQDEEFEDEAGDEAFAEDESGDESESEPEPEMASEEEEEEEEAPATDEPDGEDPEAPAPPPPPPVPALPAAPAQVAPSARSWEDREDQTIYKVVINHEEQYSIWPADRENALGWSDAGKSGTKQECLDYIESVWTDMRPQSLRKKMEELERQRQSGGE